MSSRMVVALFNKAFLLFSSAVLLALAVVVVLAVADDAGVVIYYVDWYDDMICLGSMIFLCGDETTVSFFLLRP